jgi:hypothetical protein
MNEAEARLEAVTAQLEKALAVIKAVGGCGACQHYCKEYLDEPCYSCMQDPGYPAWAWNEGVIPNG